MIELPSRDVPGDDAPDSAVSVESREFVRREGKSTLVGEDPSDSGSSVRVCMGESRESFEVVVGGRSSRASCSSNCAIGDGETSDDGSECIKCQRVYRWRRRWKKAREHATDKESGQDADETILRLTKQKTQARADGRAKSQGLRTISES